MIRFQLQLEKKEDGVVQVRVLDEDEGGNWSQMVWECTVAQDLTRTAQKAALKATVDYLNSFVDLSHGGW